MALEEAGVRLVAEGASAFASDMKGATSATDTFVDSTDKGAGMVSKAGGMMGSAIKTVAGIAAGVGVAGFLALGKAIFDGVGDAREAQQLLAQTNAVIESTGSAAGRSATQITDLATALSASAGKSLFGDSDVQAAENLLLTFTNIKGAVFDAATAISVDMAQALGGAPKDQAIALGKALNDPIKGITALSRVGVTFTEEQKATVATMVEMGDVAGAQTIILDELNKEFGGSAAAAAEADGGWAQFKDTMGELAESVGAMLLPLLNDLVGMLNNNVVPVVTAVVDAFGGVMEAFQAAGTGSEEFSDSLGTLAESLGLPADLVKDVASAIADLVKWFDDGGAASVDLGSEVEDLNGIWQKALTVIQDVMDGYMAVAQAVLPVIERFIADHGEEIEAFFKATWDSIVQIVTLALELYQAIVPPILHAIAGFINEHGEEIQKVLSGVWTAISAIITGALETIKAVMKLALDLIHGDWDAAWKDIQKIGEVQWTAIQAGIKGFLDAIAGIFNTTFDDIINVWKNNWDQLVDIASSINWSAIGQGIVDGIESGISGAWGAFTSWVIGQLDGLKDDVLAFFGISSPSKVFADSVGEPIVLGIMRGIEGTWPELTNLVGGLSADLVDDMEGIGRDIQNAIGEGFGATASIDRQIAKNLEAVGKIQDSFQQKIVMQDLETLQKKATDLFGDDPKAAADYYKMVSAHEFETLKLRQQIADASTDEEKDRLGNQLMLISRAQDAELDQFYSKQKGKISPAQNIANEINEVMKALSDPALKLTDDQLKIVDLLTGAYSQFANPPTTMPGRAYTGQTYQSTTNVSMPIYTNNTPAAMQQSWAVMNAGMI